MFTKGPWEIVVEHKVDKKIIGITTKKDNRWVARLAHNPDIRHEEEVANARLIALAPELFHLVVAKLSDDHYVKSIKQYILGEKKHE